MMFRNIWQYVYTTFFRCLLKWILRQATRKCELQRISESAEGAKRTHRIEYSLQHSKRKVLRSAVNISEHEVDSMVADIMKEKKIAEKDIRFSANLKICLLQIAGYRKLYMNVENLRKEPFDSENMDHELQLMELWNLLMPDKTLTSRITKEWGDIGFQGDDPKTDFRGMGMLGLTNLLYFSQNYNKEALQIHSLSTHPHMGYSYAIVGINLTEMAYSLLQSGELKSHFYNLVPGIPEMSHFHQFFCYLIYEFNNFWFEAKPENIMQFNFIREKFHSKIKLLLSDDKTVLVLKPSETVQ